ncbi:hypothetical protein [Caldithrix abyssi]|uniref:Uncharacterized protein n=1 Tax=Caldithrix abyssi DSM 13497 TaxID=880073 RepID=H1XPB8_CALAY|nr:hypothetical protein [Caldithrix abyssi]APF18206.1 hypothetical protein Cabys_1457 [Caldithrix abyssi DSM 13497]EHO42233.1 hypothetical protein Calab_2623 [Caldithrix abyssi DSM 13497]
MKNEGLFNRDQSLIFKNIERVKPAKAKVIKRDQVVVGQKRKIEHAMQVSETHTEGKITPVLNGEELIGIIYECSCGKVAQILFDFEETTEIKKHAATG